MALQKSHNALHVCDSQLASLKAESEATVNCLEKWQKVAEEWVMKWMNKGMARVTPSYFSTLINN